MVDYYLGGRGWRKKKVKSLEEAAGIMEHGDKLYIVEKSVTVTGTCKFPRYVQIIGDDSTIILESGTIEVDTATIIKNVTISYSPYDGGIFVKKNARIWLENVVAKSFGQFKKGQPNCPALGATKAQEVRLTDCEFDFIKVRSEEIVAKKTIIGTSTLPKSMFAAQKSVIETCTFSNTSFYGKGKATSIELVGSVTFEKTAEYEIDEISGSDPDSIKALNVKSKAIPTLITNYGKVEIKDFNISSRKASPLLWKNGLRLFENHGELRLKGTQKRMFNKKSLLHDGTLILMDYSDKTPWLRLGGKVKTGGGVSTVGLDKIYRKSVKKKVASKPAQPIESISKKTNENLAAVVEKESEVTVQAEVVKIANPEQKKVLEKPKALTSVKEQVALSDRELALLASDIFDRQGFIMTERAQEIFINFISLGYKEGMTDTMALKNEAFIAGVVQHIISKHNNREKIPAEYAQHISIITDDDVEKGLSAFADTLERLA